MLRKVLGLAAAVLTGCTVQDEYGRGKNVDLPPAFLSGPFDVVSFEGQTASFSVSAEGTDLKYVWYKNGVYYSEGAQCDVVPGTAVTGDKFSCVCFNVKEKVSSSAALLTYIPVPAREHSGSMVKIPAELFSFVMGSAGPGAAANESPVHKVTLTSSFWMDTVPVSQKRFSEVMSQYNPLTHWQMPWGAGADPRVPASHISWYDALLYCTALNRAEGIDSSYSYKIIIKLDSLGTLLDLKRSKVIRRKEGRAVSYDAEIFGTSAVIKPYKSETSDSLMPAETLAVIPNRGWYLDSLVKTVRPAGVTDSSYRLPTEAEWEFAVRAGSGSDYFWGSSPASEYAGGQTYSAALKPNLFGLYDMTGLKAHWCADFYGVYNPGTQTDPLGPPSGSRRVLRGASSADTSQVYWRSAQRGSGVPENRLSYVGFRVVKTVTAKKP